MSNIDLEVEAKQEYLHGDLVMSEMLRDEKYSGLSTNAKKRLLEWSGDDEFMTVDADGSIVEKER